MPHSSDDMRNLIETLYPDKDPDDLERCGQVLGWLDQIEAAYLTSKSRDQVWLELAKFERVAGARNPTTEYVTEWGKVCYEAIRRRYYPTLLSHWTFSYLALDQFRANQGRSPMFESDDLRLVESFVFALGMSDLAGAKRKALAALCLRTMFPHENEVGLYRDDAIGTVMLGVSFPEWPFPRPYLIADLKFIVGDEFQVRFEPETPFNRWQRLVKP